MADAPELFSRLILVDGGLPLPAPAGTDPDQLLGLVVGPALARLRETYPSVEAYLEFFRTHPALADSWGDDIEAYVRYDATGPGGAVRSRVDEPAVRADGRDLLTGTARFGADLGGLQLPALLLTAPAGMLGQPPGLLPAALVEYWTASAPRLRHERVPDTNHYTILLAAKVLAARITDPSTWPR